MPPGINFNKMEFNNKEMDKVRILAPHIGCEIKSAFISDEGTKQLLYGLEYTAHIDGDCRWYAKVKFICNGVSQIRPMAVAGIEIINAQPQERRFKEEKVSPTDLEPLVRDWWDLQDTTFDRAVQIANYINSLPTTEKKERRFTEEEIKQMCEKYSFQVPFNGTNDFYDKEKALEFMRVMAFIQSLPTK